MSVNSTVVWRIKDVDVAAVMAAETMSKHCTVILWADISKLRRDELKQATASLAEFIGPVNYSDSFHVAAPAQRNIENAQPLRKDAKDVEEVGSYGRSTSDNPVFDADGISEAVAHANKTTNKFGIEICSINIISANPVDGNLTSSFARMAKAAKMKANARAITTRIDAEAEAEASMIKAKASSDAEVLLAKGAKAVEILRAEGSKQAAGILGQSRVPVTLEEIKTSAGAIKQSHKFFFGKEPSYIFGILLQDVKAILGT